jgi:hypothetical protein
MPANARRLGPVDVAGGLWGADLLAALAEDRSKLPADTVAPVSYGLPARASTEQAARAAWTVLTAAWEEFTELHTARVERDGTDTYGQDRFTHDVWLVHLLDQLGYQPAETPPGGLAVDRDDPDDGEVDRYPITHLHAEQVPLLLLDAGVPLDARTRGVIGAHAQSPHSLVQDFLNRTTRHLWAIVTNGLTLRILRDNAALSRHAYIEFDLAAIFSDGAYADFALLWHAAHATRFTHDPDAGPAGCIAERWQDHAAATGVAALDDLRDGVEAAIAEIGQGLIEHRDNAALRDALDDPNDPFDAAALYRELLHVAYRHVFWFTLDDRDLLHPPDADRAKVAVYRDHYASTVLRGKARAHLGAHHPDGWQHFRTVAGWFAHPDGQPALEVPGLLGRLWEPQATAHVDAATLTNRRYYEAVRRLAYVTRDGTLQRINYDAMGSEELGAVYESLLEVRPTVDTAQRRFTLGRAAGSERKRTGSYYTPTSLIKVLLDEALDPVLDERIKQAVHDLPTDATPDQRRDAQERAILTTTVCDPAMGSAHFLVGAGMRIAKRLAQLRTEEVEPSPEAIQRAFRDVASRCLYGVDVNPMAVELAKVAIWLECHVPGRPLTFLDHHLKAGNALLGVGFDPGLIGWDRTARKAADQKGVPDAAFKALAGDDKAHARLLRDRNKQRRGGGGQLRLGAGTHHDRLDHLAERARQLDQLPDDSPQALAAKQRAFEDAERDAELRRQRLRADAWMASWTFPKTEDASAPLTSADPLAHDQLPWDIYYDTFLDDDLQLDRPGVRAVQDEAQRLAFFHWHLEFPDIAAAGGFGLMLGNPPWEHTELKEKEWFAAAGYPHIANAANAAARKRAIAALATSEDPVDRQTAQRWQRDSRDAQATSEFARNGERFPYGGVGRVNTYALFADHFIQAVAPWGRVGIIVPTGLITDYTYRDFFAHLVDERRLAAAYDFENKGKRLFPEVHASFRFVTLIATAPGGADEARFAFMVHDPAELDDADRSYTLTPEQIALVNPNTKTAPVFLTPRDAEITTRIYERHPVLIHHGRDDGNPWGITFRQGLFNMASDSGLFHTADELYADGWTLNGNIFERDGERMLPLYEAKMLHHYNHRWATYVDDTTSRDVTPDELGDPTFEPLPRYWVAGAAVAEKLADTGWDHDLLFGWRNITNATNERTCVASSLPRVAPNHACLLMFPRGGPRAQLLLQAVLSSFALDFLARVKMSGTNFIYAIMEQLAAPRPWIFEGQTNWLANEPLGDWVACRSAALTASSNRMAGTLGYDRACPWGCASRSTWRTELDAAMFHIYGYSRDEVTYVMDTFPIVARKDRQAEGLADDDPNWRTKRLILAKYDELAEHARAGTTYVSPDPPPPLPDKLRLSATSGGGDA